MTKNPKNPKKPPTKKTRVKSKKKVTPIKNKISPPPQQPLNPWDKQPKESTKAYTAYCIYQNMGLKRSLQKTAEKFYSKNTSNLRQISTWSSKFNWVERVGTWEREQENIKQEAHREALEKMATRHARAATQLQRKALKRLKDIQPEELNPKDTLNYITEAAKLERSARGAPDHKIEHSGEIKTHETELERMIAANPKTKAKINDILTELSTAESGGVRLSGK